MVFKKDIMQKFGIIIWALVSFGTHAMQRAIINPFFYTTSRIAVIKRVMDRIEHNNLGYP